jgi:hypothetical protein
VEAILAEFQERVVRSLPEKLAPAQLESSLALYVEWAAAHPAGYRSLMRTASGMSETRELVEASRWAGLEPIAQAMSLDLDSPLARVALRGWIGFTEAAVLAWLQEGAPKYEELVALIARALFDTTASSRGNSERQ